MIEHNPAGTKTIWYRIEYKVNTASWITPQTYKHNEQLEDEGIRHTIQWLDNSTYLLKEWMTTDNYYGFGED